jgi:hypothetical protein
MFVELPAGLFLAMRIRGSIGSQANTSAAGALDNSLTCRGATGQLIASFQAKSLRSFRIRMVGNLAII